MLVFQQKKTSPRTTHFGWLLSSQHRSVHEPHSTEMRVQTDILDRCPDNREATGLRRECVNLICALSYVALRGFRWHWWFEDVGACGFRELVKRQGLLFLLSQASHRFWVALAVFGECSRSVGPRLPVCLVDPRCQRAQLEHHLALVWERHSRCCVAYAPDSVDEVWPKTVLSLLPVVHHDHRERPDRSGSLLVFAGLASLAGPSILAFLRAG